MDMLKKEPLRLLVAIVDRGRGTVISELCQRNHVELNYICFGKGTANSEILSLLGLGSSEKDLVVSVIPDSKIPLVLSSISMRMNMQNPGRGIAFTLPISGINALVAKLLTQKNEDGKEELKPERRKASDVYKRQGTIINARGVNKNCEEKFFCLSIQEEKEILAILTPDEAKKPIMEALNRECGPKSESQALVLSLPVEDIAGI